MEEIIMEAQVRDEIGKGKLKIVRGQGFIPAVVYSEGKPAISIKLSRHDFLYLIHHHQLENAIISLKIKDDKKKPVRSCMIKEMQNDPVKGDIVHLDLSEISLTKALKVNVPVATSGESLGVKQDGGAIEHIMWEIEIECLPTEIPKNIEVDISALKIGDSIHVKDIKFPANLKVLSDPDAVVLSIASPMKEEVVAPVEGEEMKEPEVIKEKKPEAGEEAPAEEKEKKEKKEK
jgi:large subunit ribosomal protein L25